MEIHAASYIGYRREETIYKPVVALLFSVPYV